MRKGDKHLMKETVESINSLLFAEQQAWLCSDTPSKKDKRPKYKGKFNHKWENYGR